MDKFLSKAVNYCLSLEGEKLRDTCLIFPTRRACLIFRNLLSEAGQKTIWAPRVTSMRDFLVKTSGVQVASENELLLELYRVYRNYWKGVTFSRYHPWGKMLLNDFDEIDKQMTDAGILFTGIRDLRTIEQMFKPDSEELRWLKEFGTAFTREEKSELQESFIRTWEKLHPLYKEYRDHLSGSGIAYEGMAYRLLAESLRTGKHKLDRSGYIFAGLYGLTRSEEEIIKHISDHSECHVFWDDDEYYVRDKDNEAGAYFRNSTLTAYHPLSGSRALTETDREIRIVAVPMATLQGRYGGRLIGSMIEKGIENRSAVVLPDESLLPVVLNSIPDINGEINVTMGYPIEGGMIDSLFRQLYNLHTFGTRRKGDHFTYNYRYVDEIMRNPAIRSTSVTAAFKGSGNHLTTAQISEQYEFSDASVIFRGIDSPVDVFTYAEEIISMLAMISDRHASGGRLHRLSLEAVHSELVKLTSLVSPFAEEIDMHTAWQMITEMIGSYRIPLSGEPVTGVQVMGILETRALDFEHLVILSMNDDKIPGKVHQNSFIPYSLRKTFGLHTKENRESMVAYNFYRLLQRAKYVTLLYDSGDPQSGGEMSRHLLQLIYEFDKKVPATRVTRSGLSLELPPANDRVIVIPKTDEMLERLNTRLNEKYLSPSAISTYLKCPLKYYFRYLEGIKEPESPGDDIDHAQFGTILHELMYELYVPYEGKTVTESDLKDIRKQTGIRLPDIIARELGTDQQHLQGNNILKAGAIKILAERIVDHDITLAPFKIIALEEEIIQTLESGPLRFRIGGKLDRVDEVNGKIRIVDYKTGRIELSAADKIDRIFSNPSKDKLLQLYLYHMLFTGTDPGKEVTAGFYEVRSISAGFREPDKQVLNNPDLMSEFRAQLISTVTTMYDKEESFRQTTDQLRCKYCAYKDICHR